MSATTASPAQRQEPQSTPVEATAVPSRRSRKQKQIDPVVAARRARRRNNLPAEANPNEPIPKRILRSPRVWLTVVMLLAYAILLVLLYRQVVPDQEVPGGVIPGLGTEAVPIAAKYAAITVIPLSLLFLWADRYRPQRFWVWLMTFGWGACVATYVSAQVNTWAASQLSIIGDGDPATGARAAIFVAPWVEEAAKGTVLFWLAILMRYQWVSRLSGIVLAGLSGAAFAFVENILYYGRAYRFASRTFGEVPPLEALQSLFMLRGVMTFFGHPLFTAMTGIGLAVALRSKSKVVRVVAPLAGYTAAAFLHMAFNSSASLLQGTNLLLIYLLVALPLVIAVIIFTVRQVLTEGRLIRSRLGDYVRLGWLSEGDPVPLSRVRTRGKALWHAVFAGPDIMLATHPTAARGHRAGLPAGRDGPRSGRHRRPGAGEAAAAEAVRAARGWRSSSRPAAPRTPASGDARPSPPRPRTRRRASRDRPVSAATIPPRHPSPRRPTPHRWGRLLPSTPKSTPPGSLPVSELTTSR